MRTFRHLICLLLICTPLGAHSNTPLPYYLDKTLTPIWEQPLSSTVDHRVGDLRGINQANEPLSALQGRIRVVNFFFATCPGICTPTMRNLRRVQDELRGSEAVMLSYSITPLIDTPAKLATYASSIDADAQTWQLIHSDENYVDQLARETFFAINERNVDESAIVHTEKAFLVDGDGHIRGVYNATSAADLLRLVEDFELLLGGL